MLPNIFSILRTEIHRKSAPLKYPQEEDVTRTFRLLLSPDMSSLKQWYSEWFPLLDGQVDAFSPWVIDEDIAESDLDKLMLSTVKAVYDVNAIGTLTQNGYRIIEGADQVILAGSLGEADFSVKLDKYYKGLANAFDAINVRMPKVTGIFLLPSKQDDQLESQEKHKAHILSEIMAWSKEKLCKIFLIDNSNNRHMVVNNVADRYSLVGQLLYLLSRKPIDADKKKKFDSYSEWLTADLKSDGVIVNGFSAVSLCTPIDQIVETLLVRQSGKLLKEAFIDPTSSVVGRGHEYMVSFCNKVMFNSYETLADTYHRDLIDPFSTDFPTFSCDNPKVFCNIADEFDAGMMNYSETNKELMHASGERHRAEFKYALDEHIAEIISNEEGSFPIASVFLANMKDYLESFIPKEAPKEGRHGEIADSIQQLMKDVGNGPRVEALVLRAVILSGVLLFGFFMGGFSYASLGFLMGAIIAAAGSLFYWKGWKSRMEIKANEITKKLILNWKKIMDKETYDILDHMLPLYNEMIESAELRVENAGKRLSYVIHHYREEYEAPQPVNTAFWLYPVTFEFFEDMMKPYGPDIVHAMIKEDKPLELWQRLEKVDGADINRWEWELAEKVAVRLIPFCNDVFVTSICSSVVENMSKCKNFVELFKKFADPFLRLRPGHTAELSGLLESPEEGCKLLNSMLKEALEYSNEIEIINSNTPYRLTLFSILEGIETKYIVSEDAI